MQSLTKQEIKDLCENDDVLQWWAMVLFAEISELERSIQDTELDRKVFYSLVMGKIKEFPQIVLNSQIEKARKANEKRVEDKLDKKTAAELECEHEQFVAATLAG